MPLELMLTSQSGREYIGTKQNVLNEFRSYTYNLTLAALKVDALSDPESYRSSSLDFVIARSGGKGKGLNPDAATKPETEVAGKTVDTASIVKSFNKNSPGRFDFFLDGLEVETLMVPQGATGQALATKIKFEVLEPFSLNGFIDALRVSALAAGHPDYVSALFLLKVEFKGYPDSDSDPFGKAESIDYATRYFPIKFTGLDVSVTEQGTKYVCSAIPYNEQGYSTPNTLIADIKMSGKTVGEVLEDMFKSLNSKMEEKAAAEKDPEVKKNRNKYEIYFPKLEIGDSLTSESVSGKPRNDDLYSSEMNKILSENNVFKFSDPTTGYGSDSDKKPQTEDARNPDKVAVTFPSGTNIHDAITAVIRDSSYLRNILKDVASSIDEYGMVDYFKIHINTVPEVVDTTNGYRLHTFQYVVMPYKIHYTKLPGHKFSPHDTGKLAPLVKREYNYIYTGKNLDILTFNLNFNTLYFQAASPLSGNATNQGSASAAAATNVDKVNVPSGASTKSADAGNKTPSSPLVSDVNSAGDSLRGTAKSDDPYFTLAYAAHKAILDSVDMIQAEMEIMGDPYYLVTGGAGNYIPPAVDQAETKDGEANVQSSEPLVKFSFRNPMDIDETTGLMTFDNVVEYSGIYRVIKAESSMKEGFFKQKLTMIRMPGQIEDTKKPPAGDLQPMAYTSTPNPQAASKEDTAPASVVKDGVRPSAFDLSKLTNTINNVKGAIGSTLDSLSALTNFSEEVLSGIRLAASGLVALAAVGNLIDNIISDDVDNATSNLNNTNGTNTPNVNTVQGNINTINAGSKSLALTNAMGLDVSSTYGISRNLNNNVLDQVKNLLNNIPENVDLNSVVNSGVVLSNLSESTIKNLPATPVETVAPPPALSLADTIGGTAYVEVLTNEIESKQAATNGETSFGSSIPTSTSERLSDFSIAAKSAALQLPTADDLTKATLAQDVSSKLGLIDITGAAAASNSIAAYSNVVNSKDLASQFSSLALSADAASGSINRSLRGSQADQLATIKSSSADELQSKLDNFKTVSGTGVSPLKNIMGC